MPCNSGDYRDENCSGGYGDDCCEECGEQYCDCCEDAYNNNVDDLCSICCRSDCLCDEYGDDLDDENVDQTFRPMNAFARARWLKARGSQ